jgi:carboxyl-terminal processing protease
MKRPATSVRAAFLLGACTVLFLGAARALLPEDELPLTRLVLKSIQLRYVDEVRDDALDRAALTGMLSALDPYSVYVDSTDRTDLDIITTGAYGGLGVTVTTRRGRHIITAFVEDTAPGDLRLGDELLTVGGTPVAGITSEALRRLLRGIPGTTATLRLRRPGRSDTLAVDITRRDITVRTVSFADTLDGDLLYVAVDRFPRSAGVDLRRTMDSLRARYTLRGIILDLRNNPGGMLEAAVEVSELFLPFGAPIVATKGMRGMMEHGYTSENQPLFPDLPMAVLVNQGSASASEIVAGALQDHDRAVLVGTGTYGKGLVQNVLPLSHGASLKLTTARYYTPSGRCIQKLDYPSALSESAMAVIAADTQRSFLTLSSRRVVHGKGGIEPDLAVENDTLPPLLAGAAGDGLLLEFAARFATRHRLTTPPDVDERVREAFLAFVTDPAQDSLNAVLRGYRPFLSLTERQTGDGELARRSREFGGELRHLAAREWERSWPAVRRLLRLQFGQLLAPPRSARRMQFDDDRQLGAAVRVLRDSRRRATLLGR